MNVLIQFIIIVRYLFQCQLLRDFIFERWILKNNVFIHKSLSFGSSRSITTQ